MIAEKETLEEPATVLQARRNIKKAEAAVERAKKSVTNKNLLLWTARHRFNEEVDSWLIKQMREEHYNDEHDEYDGYCEYCGW